MDIIKYFFRKKEEDDDDKEDEEYKDDDDDDNDGEVDRKESKFECGFHRLQLAFSDYVEDYFLIACSLMPFRILSCAIS